MRKRYVLIGGTFDSSACRGLGPHQERNEDVPDKLEYVGMGEGGTTLVYYRLTKLPGVKGSDLEIFLVEGMDMTEAVALMAQNYGKYERLVREEHDRFLRHIPACGPFEIDR